MNICLAMYTPANTWTRQDKKIHIHFAVAIWKSNNGDYVCTTRIFLCWYFIKKSDSDIAICVFRGKQKHHDRQITLFTKLKAHLKLAFLKIDELLAKDAFCEYVVEIF